jgi:hypothetical protein
MEVVSLSPLRTGSVLWRPRPDRWTLTVVCKATYTLGPGESALAADQERVNERDGYWDDDPRRSVYAPTDLAPFKPRADVVLVGHAYAPRSEMVRSLTARLIVGEIEKAVEVVSPRLLVQQGDVREGARWSKMSLRYEYAAGGLATWNPVGIGPNAPPDVYGQRMLPNLQPPGLRVTQWSDIFVPTGFGPISPAWRLRRDKLGRYAEGWSDDGWPQRALDDDFDGEFFQNAPPDQQLDALRDDERIVLEYLSADHPILTTRLAGVRPHAFVEIPGTPARDLVMTADTLWIDTDRAVCTLTWRGQVAVEGPAQRGRVLIAMESAGQQITWADIAGESAAESVPSETPRPPTRPVRPTLPFVPNDAPPSTPPMVRPDAGAEEADAPQTPRTSTRRKTLQMVLDQTPGAMTLRLGRAPALEIPTTIEPAAPDQAPVSEPPPPEDVAPPIAPRALELIWFSSALPSRAHRVDGWAAEPESPEGTEPAPARTVVRALRGAPAPASLLRVLFASVGEDGALVPPLVALAGELGLVLDEVEALRATITAARASARGDVRLAGTIELCDEILRAGLDGSPDVAAELTAQVRDAWAQANPILPATHLAQQVERALLARRAYQRCDLLGKRWIRALFRVSPGEGAAVPAYLPSQVGRLLPLFLRFPARLVAELRPAQEPYVEPPVMLAVVALAREIPHVG